MIAAGAKERGFCLLLGDILSTRCGVLGLGNGLKL